MILTLDIINSSKDEELVLKVFEYINDKVEKGVNESITLSQQFLFAIYLLEAEINNGGFNQFYFNKNPRLAELAIEGFNLFGAPKYAELTKKSLEVYNLIKKDLKDAYDGSELSFSKSYESNPLNELDKKFYELEKEKNLQKILVLYIRNHSNEFL